MESSGSGKKELHIIIPPKCGSTITNDVLMYASQHVKPTIWYIDKITNWNNGHRNSKLCINFTRSIIPLPTTPDKTLYVFRHPLTRLISEYYSLGWTHEIEATWIQNPINRERVTNQRKENRAKIQSTNINDYIISATENQHDRFTIDKLKTFNPKNEKLLAYEQLVTNPHEYMKEVLNFIERPNILPVVMDHWKHDLAPISDRTKEIVQDGLVTHRRTSDINEWKNILDLEYIYKHINKQYIEYIETYSNTFNFI